MHERSRDKAREALAIAGLRATPQRLLVMEILEETDDHLDADAILKRARQKDPGVSLATVYRTLGKLKKAGLVDQRYLARDHRRGYYEPTSKEEHYHFTCLGCGKIIEVHTSRIAQAREELSRELGLEFARACTCFEGYCPECVAQRNKGQSVGSPAVDVDNTSTHPGQEG